VFPDDDTLVCDPSSDIASHHLLVAVAAQNYGQNSYRIRQPFDFAGRTGKIVFDAEAVGGGLLGWVSVEVTEDPISVPSFSIGQGANPYSNDEGGVLPRNGFEIQLNGSQGGSVLSNVCTFENYAETNLGTNLVAVAPQWGKLNRFELNVSEKKIELYASAVSADGVTFGPTQLVDSENVNLPFTRGYVHISVHNHATRKYSDPSSDFRSGFAHLDAWVARWDNVGFDGPVVASTREYEVADPLTSIQLSQYGTTAPGVNTGWTVAPLSKGPSETLRFHGVDLTGARTARIALTSWYCGGCGGTATPASFVLKYRLNGHAWHDRPMNPSELAYFTGGAAQGSLGQMLDVPISELVQGDNALEFVASDDVPQNYPPGVANVDLVLTTE
jgi:hypothetical protein